METSRVGSKIHRHVIPALIPIWQQWVNQPFHSKALTKTRCHTPICSLKPVFCRYVCFGWGHSPELGRKCVSCRDRMQPISSPMEARARCCLRVSCSSARGCCLPTPVCPRAPRSPQKQEGLPHFEQLISTASSSCGSCRRSRAASCQGTVVERSLSG